VNKGLLKNTLFAFILSLALFSILRYSFLVKEQRGLSYKIKEVEERAATLEKEKQNLLRELEKEKEIQEKLIQEKTGLKDDLMASKRRLKKLSADLRETQDSIEQIRSEVLLKGESANVDKLKLKLSEAAEENKELKRRLSSITWLKKALREARRKISGGRLEKRPKPKPQILIEGNRGFLIKDGKSTHPARIKIEIIPVTSKEE